MSDRLDDAWDLLAEKDAALRAKDAEIDELRSGTGDYRVLFAAIYDIRNALGVGHKHVCIYAARNP